MNVGLKKNLRFCTGTSTSSLLSSLVVFLAVLVLGIFDSGRTQEISQAELELMPKEREASLFTGYEYMVKCSFGTGTPNLGKLHSADELRIPARWIAPNGQPVRVDASARVSTERDTKGLLLLINSVSMLDAGEWRCESDVPPLSTSVRLTVKPKPVIVADSVLYGRLGESLNLSCTTNSTDNITFHWRKSTGSRINFNGPQYSFDNNNDNNNKNAKQSMNTSVLTIRSLTLSDNDTFYCVAESAALGVYVEQSIKVIVSEPVSKPHVTCANTPCAVLGKNALLRCYAKGIPQPSYEWSKDNSMIVKSVDGFKYIVEDDTLLLTNLNEADTGSYTCRAFNGFDVIGQTGVFELDVVAPPVVSPMESIKVSQDNLSPAHRSSVFEFVCRVTSNTTGVLIRWFHGSNRTLITSASPIYAAHVRIVNSFDSRISTLQILQPSKTTFGQYVCEASNVAGRSEAVAEFLFEFGPFLHKSTPRQVFAVDGLETAISCDFDGYPLSGVSWTDDSGGFLLDDMVSATGKFKVKSIRDSYIGLYTISSTMTIVTRNLNNSLSSSTKAPLIITCDAGRDSATQIRVQHAVKPAPVNVSASPEIFANMIRFKVFVPSDTQLSGRLKVTHIRGQYKAIDNQSNLLTPPFVSFSLPLNETTSSFLQSAPNPSGGLLVQLRNLTPDTLYRMNVFASSKAGDGESVPLLFKTIPKTFPLFELLVPSQSLLQPNKSSSSSSAPIEIIDESVANSRVHQCHSFHSCLVRWIIVSDGGSPISGASVTSHKVEPSSFAKIGREKRTKAATAVTADQLLVEELDPFSVYRIKVTISNKAGFSSQKEFLAATSEVPSGYVSMVVREKPMGLGTVIAIMLIVILAIGVLLGLLCFKLPPALATASANRATAGPLGRSRAKRSWWRRTGTSAAKTRNLLLANDNANFENDFSSRSTFLNNSGDNVIDNDRDDDFSRSHRSARNHQRRSEEQDFRNANVNPLYNTNDFMMADAPWNVFALSPRTPGRAGTNRDGFSRV